MLLLPSPPPNLASLSPLSRKEAAAGASTFSSVRVAFLPPPTPTISGSHSGCSRDPLGLAQMHIPKQMLRDSDFLGPRNLHLSKESQGF